MLSDCRSKYFQLTETKSGIAMEPGDASLHFLDHILLYALKLPQNWREQALKLLHCTRLGVQHN
ncbi:hypothetical protein BH10CYA1_BH10CYA1_08640 [soil metagenome]